MRNTFLKSILFSVLVVGLVACEKETVEREKDPTRNEDSGIKLNLEQEISDLDNTDVIEISTIDTLEYYDTKFPVYEVDIEGSAEEVESIVPGSIVYIPSGKEGGKLIFVTEVEERKYSTSQYKGAVALTIKGLQTSLDRYFNGEHSVLEFSTPENRAKKNSKLNNKLQSPESYPLGDEEMGGFEFDIAGLTFSSTPEQLCKIGLNATLWEKGESYVKVDGSLGVHPALDFFMEYEPVEVKKGSRWWKEGLEWMEAGFVPDIVQALYRDQSYFMGNMKELRCNLYTDVDRELNFHVKLTEEFDKPVRIPLGVLPVPTVPVSANIELAFEIDFNLLGEVEMEITSKKEEDLNFSIVFDRDQDEPEWKYEYAESTESGFEVQAKLELTAGISLVLSTEVYIMGIFGPEINAGAYVKANAAFHTSYLPGEQIALDWRLSAYAGLKCNATLNLSAFHMDKATWKIWEIANLKSDSLEIYQAPARLGIESGDMQEGSPGSELTNPIRIGAYDSRDKLITYLPVPVYFETDFGSTNPTMDRTDEGIAETTWTLGSEVQDQLLTAYFRDGDTKMGEIEVSAIVVEDVTVSSDFSVNSTRVEVGVELQFTDESTGNLTSWDWDFGDGESSTEQNPSHSYTTNGIYTVSLTVSKDDVSDIEVKYDYIEVVSDPGMGGVTLTDTEIDFTNNTYPDGWQFELQHSPGGIVNGEMQARVTDGRCHLWLDCHIPETKNRLIVEWDANQDYTYWGMDSRLIMHFEDYYIDINGIRKDKEWGQKQYLRIYKMEEEYTEISSKLGTNESLGEYHYKAIISNSKIEFYSYKNGILEVYTDCNSSAIDQDFDIHDLRQMEFRLRTTTDNNNFMDNISISLE